MRAGKLDQRLTFQQISRSANSDGWNDSESWADITKRWASVVATGGNERMKNQGIATDTDYVIEIRHTTDVNSDMRIVWGSKTLDIISVNAKDGENKTTVIQAKEHYN